MNSFGSPLRKSHADGAANKSTSSDTSLAVGACDVARSSAAELQGFTLFLRSK